MHWWRLNSAFLHLQNKRHYTPSSHCLASKSLPTSKQSRKVSLPPSFLKHRPYEPRVSRGPQADGLRRQPSFKSKWLAWARNHKLITCGFCMYGYTIMIFPRTSQRAPITERRQLYYVPCLLEDYFNFLERKMEEMIITQNSSLGSENPSVQAVTLIFKNPPHVRGLENRGCEVRVVNNLGE